MRCIHKNYIPPTDISKWTSPIPRKIREQTHQIRYLYIPYGGRLAIIPRKISAMRPRNLWLNYSRLTRLLKMNAFWEYLLEYHATFHENNISIESERGTYPCSTKTLFITVAILPVVIFWCVALWFDSELARTSNLGSKRQEWGDIQTDSGFWWILARKLKEVLCGLGSAK